MSASRTNRTNWANRMMSVVRGNPEVAVRDRLDQFGAQPKIAFGGAANAL